MKLLAQENLATAVKSYTLQSKKLRSVLSGVRGLSENEDLILNRMAAMLHDIELKSLADQARKTEMRRKGIAGFDEDMLRGVFVQATSDSHYISNLLTADKTFAALAAMKQEAGRSPEGRKYYNEIAKRHAQNLELKTPGFVNNLLRYVGFSFLAISPGFYFQNAKQSVMITLPYLVAFMAMQNQQGHSLQLLMI